MHLTFLEVEPTDTAKVTAHFPNAQIFHETLTETEIIEQCQKTEILCISLYSPLTAHVISSLPNLKLIITRTVGYNQIDLEATKTHSILVANVPDYGCHVIAEHAFALLLSLIRHILPANQSTHSGKFSFHGFRGTALRGKTLGLIGTGHIGLEVARIASLGFGMRVLAYDIYPNTAAAKKYSFQYVDLDTLLPQSDFLSLHCPLLPSTHHLLNAKTLPQIKKGAFLINTARGEIIDTPALVTNLQSRHLAGAALDVLENEKDPQANQELLALENVLVTPHIAFYADESVANMYTVAITDIQQFIEKGTVSHSVK